MLHNSKSSNFNSFLTGGKVFQPTCHPAYFPKYPPIREGVLRYSINVLELDFSTINALPTFIDRNILSKRNWNIDPVEKDLLLWHQRLGHADLSRIQSLLVKPPNGQRDEHRRRMVQSRNNLASLCDLLNLKCEARKLAKRKVWHPKPKKGVRLDDQEGKLSANIFNPGQQVSCDQYMSTTLGRLAIILSAKKTEVSN